MKLPLPAATSQTGFSLVELLVTMAIVATLAGVAVPSYIDYMRRGAVEEAIAALASGKIAAEQFYLDNRTYDGLPCPGATSKFTFSCTGDTDSYALVATGSGNVAGFSYSLDQADNRSSSSGDEWGVDAACWVLRKGQSCP
jgi:type IV pilus assembly protein PilE